MSFAILPSYPIQTGGMIHRDKFSTLEVTFQVAILTPNAQFLLRAARKVDVKLHSPAPGAQVAGNGFRWDSSSEGLKLAKSQVGPS